MVIDRRTDDHDNMLGARDHLRIGGGLQRARLAHLAQHLWGSALVKRHLATIDLLHDGGVDVVQGDPRTGVGEADAQGQSNVPAATHDHDIEVETGWRGF